MSSLDDRGLYALDATGMIDHCEALGVELLKSFEASDELELPAGADHATSVVIAGMGGSATAGDYFAALCAQSAEIPVTVARGYSLPNYVSDSTLVVVSSYSGNTEETLSCYDDAWKRGASILVTTTGGKLAERARTDGVPVYPITYKAAPRAAISHGLGPLLRMGAMLELTSIGREEVAQAAMLHSQFVEHEIGPDVPAGRNGAKQLAAAIRGRVALVLGAEHLESVASRFKNQLAENGKALGAYDTLPEADHNLIVGLGTGREASKCLSLITLESGTYDERTQRRFDITCKLFEEEGVPVHRVRVTGTRTLDQILIGTAWGDFVSCYLALLNGVDPFPVPQIDRLKAALAS